jgi:hypothetical protein
MVSLSDRRRSLQKVSLRYIGVSAVFARPFWEIICTDRHLRFHPATSLNYRSYNGYLAKIPFVPAQQRGRHATTAWHQRCSGLPHAYILGFIKRASGRQSAQNVDRAGAKQGGCQTHRTLQGMSTCEQRWGWLWSCGFGGRLAGPGVRGLCLLIHRVLALLDSSQEGEDGASKGMAR